MQSSPHRTPAVLPRDRAFWIGAAVLVLGQLVAFWMLCSQQVRKAEVRNAAMQSERVALADCLRSVPHASLTSCTQRVGPPDARAQAFAGASTEAPAGVVPVNYVYR